MRTQNHFWTALSRKLSRSARFVKAPLYFLTRSTHKFRQDLSPRPRRPKPILPTLPKPLPPVGDVDSVQNEKEEFTSSKIAISAEESEKNGQIDISSLEVLDDKQSSAKDNIDVPDTLPNRYPNPAATFIPPSLPTSTALSEESKPRSYSSSTRAPLQTSTALHEELSNQLAQMAVQLRRNAEQFNEALAKDEGVLKATQEKLERNYDEVAKERVRLRDHSAKSRGTTWLVFISILVVVIAFFMMFLLIRIT